MHFIPLTLVHWKLLGKSNHRERESLEEEDKETAEDEGRGGPRANANNKGDPPQVPTTTVLPQAAVGPTRYAWGRELVSAASTHYERRPRTLPFYQPRYRVPHLEIIGWAKKQILTTIP